MVVYKCDRCGKQMPTTTEGFWHLRHSDAKPWESALQICWECYYVLFPSADVDLERRR